MPLFCQNRRFYLLLAHTCSMIISFFSVFVNSAHQFIKNSLRRKIEEVRIVEQLAKLRRNNIVFEFGDEVSEK